MGRLLRVQAALLALYGRLGARGVRWRCVCPISPP
jgi:hypothetical protein